MENRIGAHHLLEGLVELGMEYLFANLGTDHVSIVEELAQWRKEGRSDLQVVICPHEKRGRAHGRWLRRGDRARPARARARGRGHCQLRQRAA
jgi:hypothetical protein